MITGDAPLTACYAASKVRKHWEACCAASKVRKGSTVESKDVILATLACVREKCDDHGVMPPSRPAVPLARGNASLTASYAASSLSGSIGHCTSCSNSMLQLAAACILFAPSCWCFYHQGVHTEGRDVLVLELKKLLLKVMCAHEYTPPQVHIVTRDVLVLGHRSEEKGQVVHGPSASKVCASSTCLLFVGGIVFSAYSVAVTHDRAVQARVKVISAIAVTHDRAVQAREKTKSEKSITHCHPFHLPLQRILGPKDHFCMSILFPTPCQP
eukprot:scaffold132224_cov21-Tisochrysis_lutea.AAC.1